MPYLLVSTDPKLLSKSENPWTRVSYGSPNAHDFLPEIRDVADFTVSDPVTMPFRDSGVRNAFFAV